MGPLTSDGLSFLLIGVKFKQNVLILLFAVMILYPNKISMNVLKTLMTVSIIAQTLKEGIIVLVMMAMLVLEAIVQVCIKFYCSYNIF